MTTRRMTKHSAYGGCTDRISMLPKNVIDNIMGFLPVRDAARTCVLSTKWRYAWTDQPSLVLDERFWKDIKHHKPGCCEVTIDFAGIVNSILLRHIRKVENFSVDISGISSQRHCDVNLWLSLLCKRGLKVLSLKNSPSNPYITPSCVFSAPELTSLSISRCIIKTTGAFTAFKGLRSLTLHNIILDSCVFKAPILTSLKLDHCFGISGFGIFAPELVSLSLEYNDDLNLIPYLMCTNMISASIYTYDNNLNNRDSLSVNLPVILGCWPRMKHFELNGSALEYLATGIVPESLSLVLNLTSFMSIGVKGYHIDWVFGILQNSPFLQIFEISLNEGCYSVVSKYLEEPSLMNEKMEQLHTVKLRQFLDSGTGIQLVKLMLRCLPSLKRLLIGEVSSSRWSKVEEELRSCPRTSPKVELILEGCGRTVLE